MGAMLIGMVTGFAAMAFLFLFIFAERIIITVALFFIARRQCMKAVKWAVGGFFFGFLAVADYIYVIYKMTNRKCPSCGAKTGRNTDFCANCGTAVEKADEGALVKKSVKYMIIVWAAFEILAMAYMIIVETVIPN